MLIFILASTLLLSVEGNKPQYCEGINEQYEDCPNDFICSDEFGYRDKKVCVIANQHLPPPSSDKDFLNLPSPFPNPSNPSLIKYCEGIDVQYEDCPKGFICSDQFGYTDKKVCVIDFQHLPPSSPNPYTLHPSLVKYCEGINVQYEDCPVGFICSDEFGYSDKKVCVIDYHHLSPPPLYPYPPPPPSSVMYCEGIDVHYEDCPKGFICSDEFGYSDKKVCVIDFQNLPFPPPNHPTHPSSIKYCEGINVQYEDCPVGFICSDEFGYPDKKVCVIDYRHFPPPSTTSSNSTIPEANSTTTTSAYLDVISTTPLTSSTTPSTTSTTILPTTPPRKKITKVSYIVGGCDIRGCYTGWYCNISEKYPRGICEGVKL